MNEILLSYLLVLLIGLTFFFLFRKHRADEFHVAGPKAVCPTCGGECEVLDTAQTTFTHFDDID